MLKKTIENCLLDQKLEIIKNIAGNSKIIHYHYLISWLMHDAKKRLLIVDDEQDIILPLHYLFQENGFEVVSFKDPLLALERFKPYYYDLLILDIKMPQMNGFELYRQIRRKDDGVKVCFLTALGDLKDYEQYKKEAYPKPNERHFVAKPISNDELLRKVNEMLTNNSSV